VIFFDSEILLHHRSRGLIFCHLELLHYTWRHLNFQGNWGSLTLSSESDSLVVTWGVTFICHAVGIKKEEAKVIYVILYRD